MCLESEKKYVCCIPLTTRYVWMMSIQACVSTIDSLRTAKRENENERDREIGWWWVQYIHWEIERWERMRTNEAVSQLHKNRKVSTLFRLIYSFIAHQAPKKTLRHTHTHTLRCYEVDAAYRECDNITLIRFHEQFCACFDIQNSSSSSSLPLRSMI